MTLTVATILNHFTASGLISELRGDDGVAVTGFAALEDYCETDLIFLDREDALESIKKRPPAAVVTTSALAESIAGTNSPSILITDNVKLAHALVRQVFDDRNLHEHEWPRIHPSAVIHESVEVPDDVTIGPQVVIGRDVDLGRRVVIQANAVIEDGAEIAEDAVIHARAFVGHHCRIGARTRLKPGCVIGADGFGFAQDENKRYHRVPQKGIVVIEEDVVVSANCTIDRATYAETRVCAGTKIDALCHVGHNVFLDQDCVLVAQTGIAGSSRFGKRVIASGQTGVLDHKTVVDDVVMVHRCGVTEDILSPGMYATTPPQPFREYTRNISTFRKLFDLRQRLKRLERAVDQLLQR